MGVIVKNRPKFIKFNVNSPYLVHMCVYRQNMAQKDLAHALPKIFGRGLLFWLTLCNFTKMFTVIVLEQNCHWDGLQQHCSSEDEVNWTISKISLSNPDYWSMNSYQIPYKVYAAFILPVQMVYLKHWEHCYFPDHNTYIRQLFNY